MRKGAALGAPNTSIENAETGGASLERHAAERVLQQDEALPASVEVRGNELWKPVQSQFERKMRIGEFVMPDGEAIRFWSFVDPGLTTVHPRGVSPLIRLTEGDAAEITLKTQLPVRRTSRLRSFAGGSRSRANAWMEANESYTYHWQPQKAGTWFYQSHTSSARQFEMGLYGVIVVDAAPDAQGRAVAYRNGPAYDVERFWVFDDIDPDWHRPELDGVSPEMGGRLQVFNPKYFLINGVPNTDTQQHPDVAIEANIGDKVLLRLMNASFSLVKVSIERLSAHIISVDGNVLGSAERPWTQWINLVPGQPLHLATASRHDLMLNLDPASGVKPGEYAVTVEFQNGRRRKVHTASSIHPAHIGRATTIIRVL